MTAHTAEELGKLSAVLNGQVTVTDLPKRFADYAHIGLVSTEVELDDAEAGEIRDCDFLSPEGKDLTGGYLLRTPLRLSNPDNQDVYAYARAPISSMDIQKAGLARVVQGCRLWKSVGNELVKDGTIVIQLNTATASFGFAQEVAYAINEWSKKGNVGATAVAINRRIIAVGVPEAYADAAGQFVAGVLRVRVEPPITAANVRSAESEAVRVFTEQFARDPRKLGVLDH